MGRGPTVAQILDHPVEQRRRVIVGKRGLRDSGYPDDIVPALPRRRKKCQRAAYGGHAARLTRAIGEMAPHAVQLEIDPGLVSPGHPGGPGQRNAQDGGNDPHCDGYRAVPTMRAVEQ